MPAWRDNGVDLGPADAMPAGTTFDLGLAVSISARTRAGRVVDLARERAIRHARRATDEEQAECPMS